MTSALQTHSVTLLSEEHLPALLVLEKMCFGKAWSLEQLRACRHPPYLLLGILAGNSLQGYVSAQIIAPEMEILNVAVTPACRGQGLGRKLITHALEAGRNNSATICHLEVAADNLPALRLYAGLAFSITGTRKGYYQERGQSVDALTMAKHLLP